MSSRTVSNSSDHTSAKFTVWDKLDRHVLALNQIFGTAITDESLAVLKSAERRGHSLCEQYCNGDLDSDAFDRQIEPVRSDVNRVLKNHPALKFNTDPRGYFLKIDDEWLRGHREIAIETDWGGYGIIMPDWLRDLI